MKTYFLIVFISFWVANSFAQSPQKISYVYDDLSRLSEVNYPNGTKIVYTYDALGNRQTQVITNGACTPPAAPTVSSATISSGQTATLTATNCAGTVKWYNQQTGGTLLFTGNPYVTPTLTTNTIYYASCTVNNCESSTGSGTVTVNCAPPAAPTVNSVTITSGQTATLTASNCAGTVKWYDANSGGTLLFTGNPYVTGALSATTTYYASCTVNNCESTSRGSGAVTVNCTPPAAPTVNSVTITSGQTATLTASGCAGTVTWYNALTGGTNLGTGTSYTTPTLTATTTYYASCTVNGCESTTRGSGVVTVSGGCTPPVAPLLPQMGSFTYQQFTLQASGCSGTVKWFYNATDTNPIYTGNPYITPIVFTTKTYYATCTIGSCESVKASTTLNITPCQTNVVQGTGGLSPNLYQGQTITSQKDVSNRTFYRASNSITLGAGFQAGANELFLAEIGGCATMPQNGLIAYFPFNNGSMNDESGNNNHATNNGATLSPDRRNTANAAYDFNGSNAWLNTPLVQSNLSGYTISAWVKPNFTNNQEYVILQNRGTTPGSGRSLTLHYQVSTNRWGFAIDGDALYTGVQAPSANTTEWIHVVGVWSSGGASTFNANQFKVYVNGVLLSAVAINGNSATIPNTGSGTVAIGRHEAWGSYFKGKLDDIRIYNRALSDAEVQSIYTIER